MFENGQDISPIGIYGLMALAISQRTQEMGLRLAPGSTRSRIVRLILHEASALAVIGLGIGLAGAALVGKMMRNTLYGVGAVDVSVILMVAVILLLAALLAAYLPARRAASIDPMQARRTD